MEARSMDAADPTQAQFAAYRAMWDYFNVTLFGGALRRVFLNSSRAAPRALGSLPPSAGKASEAGDTRGAGVAVGLRAA
jgi:hypothetical protein